MSPYERLIAERWMPTRFGDSVREEQRDHMEERRVLAATWPHREKTK